ncbi:transglutaminase domain-containing protein [Ruegeria atlantica]|uniref:transglutaminase domain-containing protein n=1 Tax=Ruegeria atlantica TaxID=81569 RepID=UPI00147FFD06|nr:transglutaminase domain-containing protein [Ruegeria atlantica]
MSFFKNMFSNRICALAKRITGWITIAALITSAPSALANPDWGPDTDAKQKLPPVVERPASVEYSQVLAGIATIMEKMAEPETDLVTLGLSLGSDPDAAFEFARDRLRTEPYTGSLRGPQAVLAAGGGNPQDKAEFLMHLLETMGFDARIASAELPVELAARRFSSVCRDRTYSPWPARMAGLQDQAVARLQARAKRDFDALETALAGIVPSSVASTMSSHSHYWVQMRDGEGWWDYDPSFSEARPGEAFVQPVALSRGGKNPHRVRISVKVESLRNGQLRETSVLSQEFTARQIAGAAMHLGFGPEAPGTGGLVADKLSASLGMQAAMRPILLVDGEQFRGSTFAAPGPAEPGLFGENLPPPVTAVWLELESITPDAAPRKARRMIVDLVPASRRALGTVPTPDELLTPAPGIRYPAALESVRDIVVSHGGLDPRATAERMARSMLALPGLIEDAERGHPDPMLSLWMGWVRAESFAVASEALTRAYPAGEECAFVGWPRVFLTTLGVGNADGGATGSLDWALDGIDVAGPQGEPDPVAAWRLRLWHGTVQSALETTIGEILTPDSEAVVQSTSLLLEGPLMALDSEAAGQLAGQSFAAARDLADGRILVSDNGSQHPPVWWRVDPQSGAADARMGEGGNVYNWATGHSGAAYSRMGIYYLDEASLRSWRLNPRGDIDAQIRRIERMLARERAAARNAQAAQSKANNEYSLLLRLVAIPISFMTGYVVGSSVLQGVHLALYGEVYNP